jgi:hypothetical protein
MDLIDQWKGSSGKQVLRVSKVQYTIYLHAIHCGPNPVEVVVPSPQSEHRIVTSTADKVVLVLYDELSHADEDLRRRLNTNMLFWNVCCGHSYEGHWIQISRTGSFSFTFFVGPEFRDYLVTEKCIDLSEKVLPISFSFTAAFAFDKEISGHYAVFLELWKHGDWCSFDATAFTLTLNLDPLFLAWIQNWLLNTPGQWHLRPMFDGMPFTLLTTTCGKHLNNMREMITDLRERYGKRTSRWFEPVLDGPSWTLKPKIEASFADWLKTHVGDEVWSTKPCHLDTTVLRELLSGGRGWVFINEEMLWKSVRQLDIKLDERFVMFGSCAYNWCRMDVAKRVLFAKIVDLTFRSWLKKTVPFLTIEAGGDNPATIVATTEVLLSGDAIPLPAIYSVDGWAKKFDDHMEVVYLDFKKEPYCKVSPWIVTSLCVTMSHKFWMYARWKNHGNVFFQWGDDWAHSSSSNRVLDREETILWEALPEVANLTCYILHAYGPPHIIATLHHALEETFRDWPKRKPTSVGLGIEKTEKVAGTKVEILGRSTFYTGTCKIQDIITTLGNVPAGRVKLQML